MTFLPSFLGLLAGAFFGLNVFVQRRALAGAGPWAGAFFSIGTMTLLLVVLSPGFVTLAQLRHPAVLMFALGGLFFPVAGQALQIQSISRVGPTMTSAIGAFAPFFAVIPAVLVLHETLNLAMAAGMMLMTVGLILAAIGPRGVKRNWAVWALLLPLGAALARGMVQPITRTGLIDLPNAYLATMVQGTVSMGVLMVLIALRGQAHTVIRPGPGARWFALSGIINLLGLLALNTAIGLGGVSMVAPLAASAPIWALFFGALLFRQERIGRWQVAVSGLVVLGAILIVTR